MKRTILIILTILLVSSSPVSADIRLPNILSSNMVLQQQSTTRLWGWASPGEKILITTSWNNKTDSIIGTRDANWMINIQTPAAGGPFTITFRGNNQIVLDNVMVGEVWICSGQSNMEWSYKQGLKDISDELQTCFNPQIRFFYIPKSTADFPQDNCQGEWTLCDSNSLKMFSAVGYFFGKKLNKDLHIPIGLINSNWGGSPAEVWTPAPVVNEDPVMKQASDQLKPADWWPHVPGKTFNAMIAPITNHAIAGAIWYQGESNALTASTYSVLMNDMIDAWRKAWDRPFPFYYVQIAPFSYGNKNIGALLREAQNKSMSHGNMGMVVITDLVDDTTNIHPKNKKDVGMRLANWALAETYHKEGISYKSPFYQSIHVEKENAIIDFSNASKGIMSKDKKITELYISGSDKIFHSAEGKIDKGKLIVWSKEVTSPVAVRYGFSNTAMGNLFSADGLPVGPFRTDDWTVDTSSK